MKASFRYAISVGALIFSGLAPAFAQQAWPQRNVRFLVAFAPAGPADVVARIVAPALQEKWAQTIVVENRGGAGGNLGAQVVARAEPDGYTALVTTSAFPVNLTLYGNPGYALSDFAAVARAATTPNILVRSLQLKHTTMKDIIAAAKTENLSYASAGIGTTSQLAGELIFRILSKVDVRHVPFTGAGPAANAAMSGQVPMAFVPLSAAFAFVKSGGVAGVAVTTEKRLNDLPEVPTVNETGVGNVEAATDVLFFLPAKTPVEIVQKFNADLNDVIKSGALDKAFAAAGLAPVTQTHSEAQTYVENEVKKWGEVIRAAGVKAE
jgi:tripartite-type tricarboxylate transporter receptor subunit TctC